MLDQGSHVIFEAKLHGIGKKDELLPGKIATLEPASNVELPHFVPGKRGKLPFLSGEPFQLVIVKEDEFAVARFADVKLNHGCPHPDRRLNRRTRVFRSHRAGTAMGNNDRTGTD